jgi:hypothetical protein
MKKYFGLCLLLAGCATMMAPPQTIRNEKCFDSDKMKVFQATDDGALVHICPTKYPMYFEDAFSACFLDGELAFLPVKENNDYVDEQKVQLPKGQCFAANGVYKYTTIEKIQKTIRKIKIMDSQVENSAFIEYQKQTASQK